MSRVHLLCSGFPIFQSYLPTGKNYMKELPMRARVAIVAIQAKILVRVASMAGCHHTGDKERPPVINELVMLERLCSEGCNRNDKKAWKRFTKEEGLWSGSYEWYDGEGSKAVKDKQEWIAFREAIREYLKEENAKLRDQINDARDCTEATHSLV